MLTGPRIDYPLGGRVDALVARWARDAPQAPALTWRGSTISYLDLCRAAEGERKSVAAQGIGRGDIVAVRLPRGPHLVAVLLGVLATGAAYAGAAVDWPRARFDDVVARCDARLVIDEHTPAAAPAGEPLPVRDGAPGDPCCVFATSGSSGCPRAVLTPHSGTTRIALDPLLGMDSGTRMLQISPLGWDANSLELWGPLINGGVCALHDGGLPGAQEIRRAVQHGVNTVFLTTSLFNALVDADVQCLAGLRSVMTGGEKISPRHVALLRAAAPDVPIVNGYGPVESTVFATAYRVPKDFDGGDIPIGTPIANTRILLRDNEIVLAGDGLGSGYLGEQDNARFQPDGYHTGDLARLDQHGLLHFTGRTDRQLKIRGARIAPEEVEAVMDALPGVRGSVLLAAPDGTETLAFYRGTADPRTVRTTLASRFPAAFVPGTVLRRDVMPTTANGKLDTAALLATIARNGPAPVVTESDDPAIARIVSTATELLGVPIAPDTDLFEAGANSITVIRLAGRLHLDAATVLTHRTPAAIATAPSPPRHREPDPTRWVANLPITQYRMWWFENHHLGSADMINPLLLRITGPLDTAALAHAVRAVAARHEALHTLLRPRGRRHIDAIPGPALDCAVTEYTATAVRTFRTEPFDLAADLPIRARIFRRSDTDHLLAIAVHHVAFDGWSEAVLCRDLAAAYTGAGLAPARGFRAVAREQADRAPRQDGFWSEHLGDVPDLPLDPAEAGSGAVTEHHLALPPGSSAAYLAAWVQALRAETGATDFAVGLPLVGRTIAAADDVVGCFAASAAVRFPATVRTFDDGVRHGARLLERLLADQHVPLEQIAAGREPTGRNPLCQAGFVLQNTDPAVLTLPGLTVERIRPPRPDSVFELALEIHPAEHRAVLWHRTDALGTDRAARMAEHWRTALTRQGAPV